MIFMKNKKILFGFTLIEVMVSLFLSVMVALAVYTMMISSYTSYSRIASVSKNANNIRYFLTMFSNSIKYANTMTETGTSTNQILTFKRYDKAHNKKIEERYYFVDGSELIKSEEYSVKVTTDTHHCETLGLLKRDLIVNDKIEQTFTISNIIRTIYYYVKTETDGFKRMDLGIVYDDIVDGIVNTDTGKIEEKSNGMTEMSVDTLNRRVFCFKFRCLDSID